MKIITLIIALCICFSTSANAQFLKKLAKKIEKAAEKTVERKAEQKTTKETGEAFDSIFNNPKENNAPVRHVGQSKTEPSSSYSFDHKVKMKLTSGKDVMNLNYYLSNSGDFIGTQINHEDINENFFMVFDVRKETMFTFMNTGGMKMRMGVDFEMDHDDSDQAIVITATGNKKTILGYECQEYKMKRKDMTANIWVTKDVDIRFPNDFYKIKQNKNGNQDWMKDLDGWAMEMVMIDSSNRKPKTIKLNCLSIEKSSFKINSKEYKSIGY